MMVYPGQSVTIGRDQTAQVPIADTRSSRRHLIIEREASGWLVRDLGTTNGTRVLDASGRDRELRGDAIQITSGQVAIGNTIVTLYGGSEQPAIGAQTYTAPAPAYAPPPPVQMPQYAPSMQAAPGPNQYAARGSGMPPDQRRAMLAQQIASMVASRGARVESQSDFQAVLATGQPVNHTLHAILFLLMCGIWLVPWLIISLTGGVKRYLVAVDEYGNVNVQSVKG
jgi:hypothetical protein